MAVHKVVFAGRTHKKWDKCGINFRFAQCQDEQANKKYINAKALSGQNDIMNGIIIAALIAALQANKTKKTCQMPQCPQQLKI